MLDKYEERVMHDSAVAKEQADKKDSKAVKKSANSAHVILLGREWAAFGSNTVQVQVQVCFQASQHLTRMRKLQRITQRSLPGIGRSTMQLRKCPRTQPPSPTPPYTSTLPK